MPHWTFSIHVLEGDLQLMLTKDFFKNTLTPEQKTDIETCVTEGLAYIG